MSSMSDRRHSLGGSGSTTQPRRLKQMQIDVSSSLSKSPLKSPSVVGFGASTDKSPMNIVQARHSFHHKPNQHIVYQSPRGVTSKSSINFLEHREREDTGIVEGGTTRGNTLANSYRSLASLKNDRRPTTSPAYFTTREGQSSKSLPEKPQTTQGRYRSNNNRKIEGIEGMTNDEVSPFISSQNQKLATLTNSTLSSRYFKALTCQVTAVQQLPRGFVFSDSSYDVLNCDTIYQNISNDLRNERDDEFLSVGYKKRSTVLSCFRDVVQNFRDYEQWIDSSNMGSESYVNKIISYGHPEDLFQICCYLYNDRSKMKERMEEMSIAMMEQKRYIKALTTEKESTSEYDLFKTHPSKEDVKELEESIKNIEKEIKQSDPALMREVIAMREDQQELENRIVHQQEKQTYGLDELREIHGEDFELEVLPSHVHTTLSSAKSSLRLKAPATTPSNTDSNGALYYVHLMKEKLKLLEDYILVMKKKVNRVEQVNEDVKTILGNHGSIDALLNDNKRLKREILFNDWVKKRFDHDLLLKQDYLYVDDLPLLRSVIFALQNELYSVRDQLKYYNYVENKSLKLIPPAVEPIESNPEKLYSLDRLMKEIFMDEKMRMEIEIKKQAKEQVAKERGQTVAQKDDFNVRARLRQVENENELLKKQVKRYQDENNDLMRSMELNSDSNPAKNRTVEKERESLLRSLNLKIFKLNSVITKRENHYIFQDELTKAITLEKNTLYEQNSSLTSEILSLRDVVKTLRKKLAQQSKGMENLYLLAVGLVYFYLPEFGGKKPSRVASSVIKSIYNMTMMPLLKQTTAIVRIQSWVRGIRTRKQLRENKECKQVIEEALARRRKHQIPRLKTPTSEPDIRSSDPDVPTENMKSILELLKVTTAMRLETNDLVKFEHLLSHTRIHVFSKLKQDVQDEMDTMKSELKSFSRKILEGIQTVVERPLITRSCQTDSIESRERSVQCGVSQVTHVEINRVVDPPPTRQKNQKTR